MALVNFGKAVYSCLHFTLRRVSFTAVQISTPIEFLNNSRRRSYLQLDSGSALYSRCIVLNSFFLVGANDCSIIPALIPFAGLRDARSATTTTTNPKHSELLKETK